MALRDEELTGAKGSCKKGEIELAGRKETGEYVSE